MRAAVLHSHGAVPEVGEFRDPEPEDGAELLELRAAALNPIDIRVAGGQFPLERYEPPYVAGKEGVGARADGIARLLRVHAASRSAPSASGR